MGLIMGQILLTQHFKHFHMPNTPGILPVNLISHYKYLWWIYSSFAYLILSLPGIKKKVLAKQEKCTF